MANPSVNYDTLLSRNNIKTILNSKNNKTIKRIKLRKIRKSSNNLTKLLSNGQIKKLFEKHSKLSANPSPRATNNTWSVKPNVIASNNNVALRQGITPGFVKNRVKSIEQSSTPAAQSSSTDTREKRELENLRNQLLILEANKKKLNKKKATIAQTLNNRKKRINNSTQKKNNLQKNVNRITKNINNKTKQIKEMKANMQIKSNSLKQNEQKLRNTFNKTMKQLKTLNNNVRKYGNKNNNTRKNGNRNNSNSNNSNNNPEVLENAQSVN